MKSPIIKSFLSKLVCAQVSKRTDDSNTVYHQTVNAQNSMITKEIHDQGKIKGDIIPCTSAKYMIEISSHLLVDIQIH